MLSKIGPNQYKYMSKELFTQTRFSKIYKYKNKIIKQIPKTSNFYYKNEYDILKTLNHPNIMKILEMYEDTDYIYTVMNYYHRGDYALFEEDSLLTQDAYGLLNIGVTWYSADGDWSAGIYSKNLTDEEYMIGGYQFVAPDPSDPTDTSKYTPGLGGDNTLIGYYGDPRTISLTVGYRF